MRIPALFICLLMVSACAKQEKRPNGFIAFTGATLIDGNGGTPVKNSVLLVSKGKVVSAGSKEEVKIPEGTEVMDITGKFIMPGIINAHGHVGEVIGIEGGHYSKENVLSNLQIYARYGVTTVVSLGGDKIEAESLRQAKDTSVTGHARLFIAGTIITGNTPAEGLALVDANHQMGVDFMKIRVDDNLGTAVKVPEEVYAAAINRSHELGYKVATHMYYLEDAKRLLKAGSDMMAHSVRDAQVDDEFISMMKEKGVCYCPTFTREFSTFAYKSEPDFFSDPFFKREYDSAVIKPLLDPERQLQVQNSRSATTYQRQLPTAMANAKTLSDKGVKIVFGTDSGVPTRFMGYFEHLEMEMMSRAGFTPMQIIMSSSKNAAECMGLKDLGTLTAGHWADFLILNADPEEDIMNVRNIQSVFIGGTEVKRFPQIKDR